MSDAWGRREYRGVLISVSERGEADLVALAGDLDLLAYARVKEALTAVGARTRRRLVVDLSEVSFLDSAGISVLVAARRHTRERDARFSVVCPAGGVRNALRIVQLDEVIEIFDDEGAALAG